MQTIALLLTLGAATAQTPAPKAASHASGFGLGVQTTLTSPFGGPLAGISVNIDQEVWRIETLFNTQFIEDNATSFAIGGRFLYVLHEMSMADFSVGGGAGFQYVDLNAGGDGFGVYFEGVGQIRVFLVRNVAVNATLGLTVGVGDFPFVFALNGQAVGQLGLTYFFD